MFPWSSWSWFGLDLDSQALVAIVWQKPPPALHFQKGCPITNLEQTPPIITTALFLQQHQQQMICKACTLFMKCELVPGFKALLTILSTSLTALDPKPEAMGLSLALPLCDSLMSHLLFLTCYMKKVDFCGHCQLSNSKSLRVIQFPKSFMLGKHQ